METSNYHYRFVVNRPLLEVFAGITNLSGWWAKDLEGSADKEGDQFKTIFGETWCLFKVTSSIPGKKLVWHAIDCHMDLLKNKKEWKDTEIIWEFRSAGYEIEVYMTHLGLKPGIECFEDCTKGWNFFLGESLLHFLNEGTGLPANGIRATISAKGENYRGTLYSAGQAIPENSGECLLLDVKEMAVEHILSIYSIEKLSAQFDLSTLKGKYYMLIANPGNGLSENLKENINS